MKADTGYNRSGFQRFLQIIHDADGVTVCNKDGATVDAQVTVLGLNVSVTMPTDDPCDNDFTAGTYPECGSSSLERGRLLPRLDHRQGVALPPRRRAPRRHRHGRTAVSRPRPRSGHGRPDDAVERHQRHRRGLERVLGPVDEQHPPADAAVPEPPALLRHRERQHERDDAEVPLDLDGTQVGTSVCPERVITDPDPTAPDASPDGLVHGLRSCADGDWLYERDNDTIFMGEDFNFYASITPLVTAFANHNREDLHRGPRGARPALGGPARGRPTSACSAATRPRPTRPARRMAPSPTSRSSCSST